MPKRTDIKTILIIGSGPIVIGQGCEFDYSGTQACKALREEGYQVVLINSNPATIMTDPETADRTYIEPITPETVAKIIEKERNGKYHIDALLPTLGGQTALNCGCKLWDEGVLQKYSVEMIGANREVIYRAEDRKIFKEIVEGIGLKMPRAATVNTLEEAWKVLDMVGLPAIIRPAFTLGGTGGGIAYNREEFEDIIRRGLDASMTRQVLIDQSVLGWKEYELELMRDREDNVVIICSIENVDPMGVHTGDSITVAPAQTLTDREYQRMRDASLAIIRAIGVETGGCNIQFAINPNPGSDEGEMVVVEMNPRVSRSSALASKATGFPIAKIAAKLAVGYTMWELPNDITRKTVACFEPTIDYVVTKIPRWTFEKFPEADETLTTQMKSVGEAMSIGRTFKESLQKGIRSMEVKRFGLGLDTQDKWFAHQRAISSGAEPAGEWPIAIDKLKRKLSVPSQGRLYYIRYAFKLGWTIEQVFELTKIDPWFLDQIKQLVDFENVLTGYKKLEDLPREVLFEAKQLGYSDPQLAMIYLGKISPENILKVRAHRKTLGIEPVYKLVDTCAAEFEAATPYYYSTYESPVTVVGDGNAAATTTDDEIRVTDKKKIVILGGGPNRIGQGIEFDYCCVQAAFAADELGFESVMINSNPETVSTDYDTSDLLFFEPLTLEDVLNVCERLNGEPLEWNRRVVDLSLDEDGYSILGEAYGISDYNKLLADIDRLASDAGYENVGLLNGGVAAEKRFVTATDRTGTAIDFEFDANWRPVKVSKRKPVPGWSLRDDCFNVELFERFTSGVKGHLLGVIVQFGGQTPLNLSHGLQLANVPIIGTSVDSIDLTSNRERFAELLKKLGIRQPRNGIAYNIDQARDVANQIGYPVLVRPSFVLGGRAMETVFDDAQLKYYMAIALGASDVADQPILIDKFLSEAIECDVDVIADYGVPEGVVSTALVAGVMEHIEEAGIHSGDSACAIPPYSLPAHVVEQIKAQSRKLAEALKVRGLMNVQYAIKRPDPVTGSDYEVYVIEVNPRASRTVPFVSKATGASWARLAAKVMAGKQLAELGVTREITPKHTSVKESVFPFNKFPGVDVILGPEMRSTGEVMGIDPGFPIAFAKSQMAVYSPLPSGGRVFLSVRDSDKSHVVDTARRLTAMGFEVITTDGTRQFLEQHGIKTQRVNKISEGRPNALDLIKNREVALIVNTPSKKGIATDEGKLRSMAVRFNVPVITTTTGAAAAVQAMEALRAGDWTVRALQDYFPKG